MATFVNLFANAPNVRIVPRLSFKRERKNGDQKRNADGALPYSVHNPPWRVGKG